MGAVLLGAAAAAIGTPTGVSGGLLLLPLLLTVFGLGGTVASATNLLFNIVSTPAGVLRQVRRGQLDPALTWLLVVSAAPAAVFGALLNVFLLGLGGAVLAAPAALLLTRWPVSRISGAALVGTLTVSLTGLASYALLDAAGRTSVNTPDWPLGLALGAGGVLGAYAGVRFAGRIPDRLLRTTLAVVVAFGAARLVLAG